MKIGRSAPPQVLPAPNRDPIQHAPGDRRGNGGTFGFDELGVFGLNREQPLPNAPDRDPTPRFVQPEPLAAEVLDNGLPSLDATSPSAPTLLMPPSPQPEPMAPGVDAPEAWHAAPELSSNESGGSGEPLEVMSIDTSNAGPAEESAPALRPRPLAASKTDYSLVVSLKEGRVSIAVGGAPLDGEGRTLLRRLVRELLLGRRLSLADFQLNGVPLGADFIDITGGIHGPRSR